MGTFTLVSEHALAPAPPSSNRTNDAAMHHGGAQGQQGFARRPRQGVGGSACMLHDAPSEAVICGTRSYWVLVPKLRVEGPY